MKVVSSICIKLQTNIEPTVNVTRETFSFFPMATVSRRLNLIKKNICSPGLEEKILIFVMEICRYMQFK